MAKSKPKKKYVPKPVRFPQLLNGFTAFLPVITALETILRDKTILVGPRDDYVYVQANGLMYSLFDELTLFENFIARWCERNKREFDVRALIRFKTQLTNKTGFDEEIVSNCLDALKLFQRVFSACPAGEARHITKAIKIQGEFERIEAESQN